MIKNYFKTALRNLGRNKTYSLINVMGLALGMTCAILLYLYIQDETSYDHHHKKLDRIYRISTTNTKSESVYHTGFTTAKLAGVVKKEASGVASVARILRRGRRNLVEYKNKKFTQYLPYADSSLFNIFTIPFVAGNSQTALNRPHTTVFSESVATKIFGSASQAMGKAVYLSGDTVSYEITGVFKDIPQNSTFKFDGLKSLTTIHASREKSRSWGWMRHDDVTFVALKPQAKAEDVQRQLNSIPGKYFKQDMTGFGTKISFGLQPLKDIHLHSRLEGDIGEIGDVSYVYIFMAVALFMLIIAAINYMNLSTARSVDRAKEVGIRKVIGSHRRQLIGQFLVEASMVSITALLISLSLVEILLPWFNQIADKSLGINYLTNPLLPLSLLGFAILVGLISGFYPAFLLSRFRPATVLKGKFGNSRKGTNLRKVLVVFQFGVSAMMMLATFIVYEQLQFVRDKNLGYNKDQMLIIPIGSREAYQKIPVIKQELLRNPAITKVATGDFNPGTQQGSTMTYRIDREDNTTLAETIRQFQVDYDFFKLMEVAFVEGRNFKKTMKTDEDHAVIVNEAFVKRMGWQNPLGKKLEARFDKNGVPQYSYKVVGVTKNFHMKSLHEVIEPAAFFLAPNGSYNLMVRMQGKKLSSTVAYAQRVYQQFDDRPFMASFADQALQQQYSADQKRGSIFLAFAIITIFIACLGLFGLVSFMTKQRNKEIGIRKVLGASVSSIIILISRNFVGLVLLASVLAFPVAYFLMKNWLQNFAYKTAIGWSAFALVAVAALLIAVVTVSYQAFSAARLNPVKVLKDE